MRTGRVRFGRQWGVCCTAHLSVWRVQRGDLAPRVASRPQSVLVVCACNLVNRCAQRLYCYWFRVVCTLAGLWLLPIGYADCIEY